MKKLIVVLMGLSLCGPLSLAVSAKPVWGTSPITERYPYVSTGSFTGPAEPLSPDPLVAYRVNFEVSAAVYAGSSQATQAGDALLIEVLRADNSVLASTTNAPGAWTGKMTFTPASFHYKGDGSGDVRLRIGPAGTMNSGRFHGAIDNIMVKEMK